ncbi:Calcineurin-like phosphoesterase superfamily domain [Rubrobacter radiotolerans]|uniref:Calcineurin-like phosphoesterase superfamily domain n=1 Tax=Rubrobacter radiotolerans TaxID=42256 RepID=A0A023X1B5_RUBRA|nr:metallophosphoesterase family protein [Rubrobacter radiotolerans]AHY45810.1 Calcineurin-like phosphoesterase superfamily domain [Rubrobacter radiotolerans]MDX5893224.1 metallophosphoesterase family protein [Rubrobacter radiotolerans]SMC03311.1 Predicted phosphodiesterase [Rubrobacter radiotolerans DSM 5868]
MYAVISDIHGNFEALEAVLRDVPEGVEEIYCLGDVIGYGASPNECCEAVREREMPTITGNHDLAVTDLSTDLAWFNPVAARAVLWTRERLTEENARFLRERPRMMQRRDALFVHGSVRDPDEYIVNTSSAEANLQVLREEYSNIPVCFYGHTHVKAIAPPPPESEEGGDVLDLSSGGPFLVNPGSVGQPRDGDTFASYVLVEPSGAANGSVPGPRVLYRFVEYDIEQAQAKIRAAGLPEVLAERLAVGR